MRDAVLKLTMDYKMTKHVLNNSTLAESRTWLLVITWHCYFISFNSEHPHGSLETFGGPQRHAIAHLKAGKIVIPNMSSVMLGKSVLF